MSETTAPAPAGDSALQRLVTGRSNVNFIGRSRQWLYLTLALIALSVLGIAVRGLNFGIEFTGGTAFTVTGANGDFTSQDLRDALGDLGIRGATAQVVDGGQGALISTPAIEELDQVGGDQQQQIIEALAGVTGADADDINVSAVGPRWGQQISREALKALAVFLALVVLYISFRFEWRMAVAAVVTLLHDILVTVGVYALVGFEVTPSSVIAFLTILGYSLYDTVVVFDRVAEESAGLTSVSTATYGETANRALNEVLVRSLSTSVTSILPVASLLFLGATLLGADTLQDLALALFIGMAIGTYSSIFVATPLLVWLKEKDPRFAELKRRVESRRGGATPATAGAASAGARRAAPRNGRRR